MHSAVTFIWSLLHSVVTFFNFKFQIADRNQFQILPLFNLIS
jgi:hypothetical protein